MLDSLKNKMAVGLKPVAVIVASCILTFSAHAQDGVTKPSPAALWIGLYAGGHVGGGTTNFDSVFDISNFGDDAPGDVSDSVLGRFFELDGGLAGVHVGFNRSNGRFVYGIEADWSHFNQSDILFDQDDEGLGTTDNASVEINWLASLRGRFGITSAQTLFYATAGVAWVDASYTARDDDGAAPGLAIAGSTKLNGVGFVVGGGLEHAITNQFSVRLESLYYKFDKRRDTSALNNDSDVGDFAKLEGILVARLGLTYKLTGTPEAARLALSSIAPMVWSGFYVGVHLGYGRVDFDSLYDSSEIDRIIDVEDSVNGRFFDLDGGLGGIHIGYNQSYGRFVYGIEADWSHLDKSDLLFDQQAEPEGTDSASADLNWLASVRGRIGVTSAQTLFYATAGIAWIDADYTSRNGDENNVNQGSTDLNDSGFVIGGGMEHAITENLLIRFEGLHYDFGDRKDTSTLNTDSDPGDFAVIDDINVVRIGLSYKFNSQAN